MFCKHCGHNLPDDARFCTKCGKPQGGQTNVAQEIKWEICTITYEEVDKGGLFKGPTLRFWGKAIGPKGSYNAGQSRTTFPSEFNSVHRVYEPPFKNLRDVQQAKAALDELVSKLSADGWEHTGQTNQFAYYTLTFRRQAR